MARDSDCCCITAPWFHELMSVSAHDGSRLPGSGPLKNPAIVTFLLPIYPHNCDRDPDHEFCSWFCCDSQNGMNIALTICVDSKQTPVSS